MSFSSIVKNRVTSPFKLLIDEIKQGQAKLGFTRFFASIFRGTSFSASLVQKIHKIIISQLEKEFLYVLDKYRDYSEECVYASNSPVWVSWMQGYDDAPIIVKKCIDSIKASTTHPVHIISKDNISEYVDIPDFVMAKYDKGIITNAQFSDILRMSLLSRYGGLWIDATIFIPKELPEEIFRYQFFTCKREPKNSGYVSNYMWTSFLNGCQKNCVVQRAVKDLFLEYWKKKDYLIDYLLVDYFMMIVYRNLPSAKKLIDEVPYNNLLVEELQNRMSMPFNQQDYDDLIYHSDTYLFKLSWRMNFDKKTVDGDTTYFAKFLCD